MNQIKSNLLSYSSHIRVNSLNFSLIPRLSFHRPNSIIINYPKRSVLKVLNIFHTTHQPYKKSNNHSGTQPNTEWDKAGSKKFSCRIPSERVGVKVPVKAISSIVPQATNDTGSQGSEQALNCEKEGDVGGKVGSAVDNLLLGDVEKWLQETSDHAQYHGFDHVEH